MDRLNVGRYPSYTLRAEYSGDINSNPTVVDYGWIYKNVDVLPATTSVANLTPAQLSTDGSLQVRVDGVDATGLVSFYDGTKLIGTAAIVDSIATLTDALLPVGSRALTAVYSGDANNASSRLSFAPTVTGIPVTTVIAQLDPLVDRTVTQLYTREGRLQGVLDAEGYLTEYKYNAAGELVETIRYANVAASFTSVSARLAAVAIARASYNLAGVRPAEDIADIKSYNFYDASGRLVGHVDGEG